MKKGTEFHASRQRREVDIVIASALAPLALAGASAAAVATMAANRSKHAVEPVSIAGGGKEFALLKMRGLSREHAGKLGRMATLLQRVGADEALQILQVLESGSPLALGGIRPVTAESVETHKRAAVDLGVPELFDTWSKLTTDTAPAIFGPGRRFTHEHHTAFGAGADTAVVDTLLVGAMEREVEFMDTLTPRRYLSEVLIKSPQSLAGLASRDYAGGEGSSVAAAGQPA